MYSKDDGFSVGKKIPSKPCNSLCEVAQKIVFFVLFKSQFFEYIYLLCHCEPVRTLAWQSPREIPESLGDPHTSLRTGSG